MTPQTPKSFHEVLDAYVELGKHTGKQQEAEAWVQQSLQELEGIKAKVKAHMQGRPPIRVAFFEWIEPIYAAGRCGARYTSHVNQDTRPY